MLKFSVRLAALSALGSSLVLSGCELGARVVSVQHPTTDGTIAAPITETFHSTDKMDVLIAVDPSNLSLEQQRQVAGSIDLIIAELESQNVDYHVGMVGTGGASVSGGFQLPIPLPFPIPGIGSSVGSTDGLSAGLGALTQLGDTDRFLTHSQRKQLEDDLIQHVLMGVQNKMGSSTRAKFEQGVMPLLPIVVKAAQGGSSQQDLKSIYTQVAPLVLSAVSKGQMGGNYDEAIKAVLPIVQKAAGGGTNNQSFDTMIAVLLPIAIDVGLKSQGSNPYVMAASIMLPAMLQLTEKAQHGASFDELMNSVIPIILSNVGKSDAGGYLQMVALVTPMITTVVGSIATGHFEPRELMGKLLPMALSSINSQGGSNEYVYLLSAVMPVVLNMIQDQKMGNDPNKLLETVSQLGLATVLGAIDKGKTENGGVNAGFLRDDAILQVLMVGEKFANTQKQDPKELANSFVKILLENKSGAKEKLAFDAILGGSTNICSSQSLKDSSVYKEIAQLTNGQVGDLCNTRDNFGDILVSSILSKLTEYSLAQEIADPNLIQVLENGIEVPQDSVNGWSTNGKTIKLNGSYIPAANSEIVVRYVPAG